MSVYQPTNFDFRSLFTGQEKLVFLAGAGISMNPPSNLPSANLIVTDIIRFTTPSEASNDLLDPKNGFKFRFEMIIQIFQQEMDRQLNIINYFDTFTHPNSIHYFLAEMIKQGQIVLTTNFDNLIEFALGVKNPKAKVIITKNDFSAYPDPEKAFNTGFSLLYKIHGSNTNVFTGEKTRHSIVATMAALGKGKEDDIFSLQGEKLDLFTNAAQGRSLIVLGYSGGDDFDIIPVLRKMTGLKQIIWLDYVNQEQISNEIIQTNFDPSVLMDLHRKGVPDIDLELMVISQTLKIPIIKVKGMTNHIIDGLGYTNQKFNINEQEGHAINTYDWLKGNFPQKIPGQLEYCAMNYYMLISQLKKSKEWLDRLHEIVKKYPPSPQLGLLKRIYASNQFDLKDRTGAIKYVNEAIEIDTKIGNKPGLAEDYAFLSNIIATQGNPDKAIEIAKQALILYEELKDYPNFAKLSNTIGKIMFTKGDLEQGLKGINRSIDIAKKIGDLHLIAINYLTLGQMETAKGDHQKAYDYYRQGHDIELKLGKFNMLPTYLIQISGLMLNSGKTQDALQILDRAYQAAQKVNDVNMLTQILAQIGSVHQNQGDRYNAMKFFNQAYNLAKNVQNPESIANSLNLMGDLNLAFRNFDNAEKQFLEAYNIHKQLEDMAQIVQDLTRLANLKLYQQEIDKAKEFLTQAQQLGESYNLNELLTNVYFLLGRIDNMKGNRGGALEKYEKAYTLAEKLKKSAELAQICAAMGEICRDLGQFKAAITRYEEAYQFGLKCNSYIIMAGVSADAGILLANLGNLEIGLKNLQRAHEIYKNLHLPDKVKQVEGLIQKIEETLKKR